MNNQEFDDIIKESAQQREAAVPPEIWEEISKKKRKRRYPFFWIISLGILLAGFVFIWNINNKKPLPGNLSMSQEKESEKNPTILKTKEDKRNDISIITSNENTKTTAVTQSETINATKKSNVDTETLSGKQNNKNKRSNSVSPAANKTMVNKSALNKQETVATGSVNKKRIATEEEIFASSRNKRTSEGEAKLNVIPADAENNNNELLIDKIIVPGTKQDKTGIAIANDENETDKTRKDMESELAINDKTAAEGKTAPFIKTNAIDSLSVLKIEKVLEDSSSDNKKVDAKKEDQKNKKHASGLKMETGFSVVFPIQDYEKPLAVKRFMSDANANAEFTSNNIQTSLETGFSVNIGIVKTLSKKWDIGAGLNYTRFTEKLQFTGEETTTKFSIIQILVTNGNNSFLKTDTISALSKAHTTLNARNVYNNFGVSPFVRYNIVKQNKFSLAIVTGMYVDLRSYDNKLPGEFEVQYSDGRIENKSKKTIGIDFSAGLHFSGSLWKKYEWFAAAAYRYNLSGYNSNVLSFNKKIHIPAITFGIACHLKK